MKMTPETIAALAQQLAGIAALFNPQTGAAIRSVAAVVAVAQQLNELVGDIRDNAPDVWAQVQADYAGAARGFEESVAKRPGEG